MTMINLKNAPSTGTVAQKEDTFNQEKMLKLSNRSLFIHLHEEGILKEKDVKNLRFYVKMYRHSKTDVGAPRVTQSNIGSIASKFSDRAPLSETTEALYREQDLITFRALQRTLYKTHRGLITFVERLFDEPKNLLDFYNGWPKTQQEEGAKTLKALSSLMKL